MGNLAKGLVVEIDLGGCGPVVVAAVGSPEARVELEFHILAGDCGIEYEWDESLVAGRTAECHFAAGLA